MSEHLPSSVTFQQFHSAEQLCSLIRKERAEESARSGCPGALRDGFSEELPDEAMSHETNKYMSTCV